MTSTPFQGRLSGKVKRVWPVKYQTMFHMTNDSHLFRTQEEMMEKDGAYPVGSNRYDSQVGENVPLYEGKMVQAYDHRAASVVVNPVNPYRPGQKLIASLEEHQDSTWSPLPRFWVLKSETSPPNTKFLLGFKHVTAPTNVRSMIAAVIPAVASGNSFPLLTGVDDHSLTAKRAAYMVANLNALSFDYVLRQKVQGQNLNWCIVEQMPVISLERFETECIGSQRQSVKLSVRQCWN